VDTSQNPPGASCLVHCGQVAKQHESSFLYDSREGRLFRLKPHFAVGNSVVPGYVKDPLHNVVNERDVDLYASGTSQARSCDQVMPC